MPTLVANNLSKKYGKRKVVKDVSFEISSGRIVGLLGPNGAGKTTCFYMVVGLIHADNGSITIDGKDITHCFIHGRAQMGLGYLPQEASIFRKMTVADNILAVLETRKTLSRLQRKTILTNLLEEFNIGHLRDLLGISLSGGERRRVEIARALAMNPSFLLLDEPFAGVDPISINDIKTIIKQLKSREIGVFITDHNVRETLDVCEHAYIVSEGTVIAQGDSHSVMQNKKVREVYLGEHFYI